MARRLNVPALGVAIGLVWGVCVLLITWLNALSGGLPHGWFAPFVRALDYAYPGYGPGFWGGIWGGICGLLEGLILGAIVAILYNRLATPLEEGELPTAEE